MSVFIDHELARRLERAEGAAGAAFIEVRQRMAPEVRAEWRDFDGTYAMFDGIESPMTQTFGLGMFAAVDPDHVAAIERFFIERGADAQHEVSPLAGVDALALLAERGYRPVELSTVLVQPLADIADVAMPQGLVVRECSASDRERWIATSVVGWSENPEVSHVIEQIAQAASHNRLMRHFLVERDGEAIATGSLVIHDRVALLAGASTIPAGRGRGAQGLLLASRLVDAKRRGCDIAMMVAQPASTSQRNAERRGFRVAYTRTKWRCTRQTS
jgi:hypothetical protein